MGALALAKGTGSFGAARTTGTVVSAETEVGDLGPARGGETHGGGGCQEEEGTCHRCGEWGLRKPGSRV
jgi:hypothetical protein